MGKGGGLAIVIGPKKAADENESGSSLNDLKAAAPDLISAIKSGDADAVAEAFHAMHEICASGYSDEEEEKA